MNNSKFIFGGAFAAMEVPREEWPVRTTVHPNSPKCPVFGFNTGLVWTFISRKNHKFNGVIFYLYWKIKFSKNDQILIKFWQEIKNCFRMSVRIRFLFLNQKLLYIYLFRITKKIKKLSAWVVTTLSNILKVGGSILTKSIFKKMYTTGSFGTFSLQCYNIYKYQMGIVVS